MDKSIFLKNQRLEKEALLQFVKYGFSGGIATIVHIFIFYILAWKFFPALQENDFITVTLGINIVDVNESTRSINSMLSNGGAFLCSNMVAYIINVFWVFQGGRHNKIIEIGLFYLVSGISVAIGTSLMGFLINYYGIQTSYAFGVNIFSAVMINYGMRKFYIFKG